jgi:hypothetical protein
LSVLAGREPDARRVGALHVAGLILLYGLAYGLMRWSLSSAIGTDDAWAGIYAQTFELGYELSQPPLYEWILFGVQAVVGPGVQSFLIVKFGLLALTGAMLFEAARLAIPDRRHAALAVFSLTLFYQIGWNMMEGVTNTLALVAACAATAMTVGRILTRGGIADYLLLGLAAGCGFLAKFGYGLFLAAMAGAILAEPVLRRRLSLPKLGLAAVVAALLISPYLLWIVVGDRPLGSTVGQIMKGGDTGHHALRVLHGLTNLATSLVGFSLPFLVLALLVFWTPLRQKARPAEPGDESPLFARLYARTVLFAIGLSVAAILATGSVRLKERHMHPLLLLMPVALFAALGRRDVSRGRYRLLVWIVIVANVAAFGVRVVVLTVPDKTICSACRASRPYDGMAAGLKALGVGGTLVGLDPYTAGNLRASFPEARVLMFDGNVVVGPGRGPSRTCWIVWEAPEGRLPPKLAEAPPIGEDHVVTGHWTRFGRPLPDRVMRWGARQVDPAASLCHPSGVGSATAAGD